MEFRAEQELAEIASEARKTRACGPPRHRRSSRITVSKKGETEGDRAAQNERAGS